MRFVLSFRPVRFVVFLFSLLLLIGYILNFQNLWEYKTQIYDLWQWFNYQIGSTTVEHAWNSTHFVLSVLGIFIFPLGSITGWIF